MSQGVKCVKDSAFYDVGEHDAGFGTAWELGPPGEEWKQVSGWLHSTEGRSLFNTYGQLQKNSPSKRHNKILLALHSHPAHKPCHLSGGPHCGERTRQHPLPPELAREISQAVAALQSPPAELPGHYSLQSRWIREDI